jgi:tetratricopeptide (TPR) repeat protein
MLSLVCFNQGLFDQAKEWCLKAYKKRDQMPMLQNIYTNWVHALCFETPYEEIKYLRQIQEIDDQMPVTYWSLGNLYNVRLFQYEKAIPELEKALKIYNNLGFKPMWVMNYTSLGLAYHKTHQYNKERKLYKKAEQDFPDDPRLIYRQAFLSLTGRDTVAVMSYIEKYKSVQEENSLSKADIMTDLAGIYSEENYLEKVEKYYQEALFSEPKNPLRMNNYAYFLIDKGRNIDEGLELVDRALKLQPDNFVYLDCKGWGLYKQGKIKEAYELIEKAWNLKPVYTHRMYLHLQEVKKAVAGQK